MHLVMIEWEDSAFAQGWMNKEAIGTHKVSDCISVGLLVFGNDKQITIMQSVSKGQYGDGLTIPKRCIKRIRKLKIERR